VLLEAHGIKEFVLSAHVPTRYVWFNDPPCLYLYYVVRKLFYKQRDASHRILTINSSRPTPFRFKTPSKAADCAAAPMCVCIHDWRWCRARHYYIIHTLTALCLARQEWESWSKFFIIVHACLIKLRLDYI
jgi:hypothetical protein